MRVLGIIISLPLIFFLPGYALFRSRLFAEHRMEWLPRLLLIITLSVVTTSLVAMVLAETGVLRLWLLDIILAVITAALTLAFDRVKRAIFAHGLKAGETAIVIVLCLLAVACFFRPFEFVIGDGDSGYNFNNGYHIAQTGAVNVTEKSVEDMTDAELEMFYSRRILQFMPFHLRDRQTGRIQPLLYHLLPVWIGIFIMLFGTWGGLFVVPLFSLLSVLALFALARRFTGLFGAAAGAVLFCLFFPQFYFAREPLSEMFCQFFVIVAALFFREFLETRGTASALAAASAAIAAAAVRPEALILPLLMLAVMFGRLFTHRFRAGDYVHVNALLVGFLLLWFYMLLVQYSYLAGQFRRLSAAAGRFTNMQLFLAAFLGATGLCFLLFNAPPLHRRLERAGKRLLGLVEQRAPWISRAARGVMGTAVLVSFIVFYFVYPHRPGVTAASPQKFFFYTAAFFGGVAVFVFVAGLCLLIFESDTPGFSFLLAVGVVTYTYAFTESAVTNGYQPWLLRRYIPLVIPALFLGFAYLAGRFWETRRPALRAAAALTAAGFVVLFCYFAWPVFNHVEYRGVNRQIEALASKLDDDVVVFTEGFTGEAFGIPLRYQHGIDARRAFTLDSESLRQVVEKYSAEGRDVLVEAGALNMLTADPEIFDDFSFEKELEYTVSFPRLSKSYAVRPVHRGTEAHDLSFFRVEPRTASPSDD